jgi:nucleotide-binding universal stress UspA family protein
VECRVQRIACMSFKKIFVAVDFSAQAREALRVAANMAATVHAELTLVHVWQSGTYTFDPSLLGPPGAIHDDMLERIQQDLTDWKHRAQAMGATRVRTAVIRGSAWKEIIDLLKGDRSYDLVVLGTHGRTGLSHAILGSVAEKIVRHAPCPALVVHAPN